MSDVLVLYVEPFGPTAQVAMQVAEQLCRRGLHVELRRVGRAHLSGHRAVVLGGATATGSWDPAALDALRAAPWDVRLHLFHTAPDPRSATVPHAVLALAAARGAGAVPVLPDPDGRSGSLDHRRPGPALRWADELADGLVADHERLSLVG